MAGKLMHMLEAGESVRFRSQRRLIPFGTPDFGAGLAYALFYLVFLAGLHLYLHFDSIDSLSADLHVRWELLLLALVSPWIFWGVAPPVEVWVTDRRVLLRRGWLRPKPAAVSLDGIQKVVYFRHKMLERPSNVEIRFEEAAILALRGLPNAQLLGAAIAEAAGVLLEGLSTKATADERRNPSAPNEL